MTVCVYLFVNISNFICMYKCGNNLIEANSLNKSPSQLNSQGLA